MSVDPTMRSVWAGREPKDVVSELDAAIEFDRALGVKMGSKLNSEVEDVLQLAKAEILRLRALINSPVTDDWLQGVRLEAAHQQERWGSQHDGGKTDPDWFWLVGFLAGKALFAAMQGNTDKAKHHTISTGAALLNWWRHISGDATGMRPGIEPPKGEQA